MRDGYMVYNWGDQSARSPTQAWASASKAVVSTMLFFAINEGRLSGPDVTVRNYVQQQFPGEDLIAKDVPMTFFQLANVRVATCCPRRPATPMRTTITHSNCTNTWCSDSSLGSVRPARARWPRRSRRPSAWARSSSRTDRSSLSSRARLGGTPRSVTPLASAGSG